MTATPPQSRLRSADLPVGTPARPGGAGVVVAALVTCALAVAAVWVVADLALTSEAGQRLDQEAMEAVYAREAAVEQLLSLLGYISIGTTALALLTCVVLALVRRRYAAAAAAVGVVAGANVTTQLLKRVVLDRPDYGNLAINSLPSGHTTVVTSIVLAALLVAPVALRELVVGLGTLAITFTATSTIAASWHRPSDVVAAMGVSLAWGSAAVVVLALRRRARFSSGVLRPAAAAVVGALLAGVLLLVSGVRPLGGWSGFTDAALVLGGVGLACVLVVAWFSRLSSVHSA